MPDELPERNDFTETLTEKIYTTEGSGNRTSIVTFSGKPVLVEHPGHPEDDFYEYPEKSRVVVASGPKGNEITQAESAVLFRDSKAKTEAVLTEARNFRIEETAAAFNKRVEAAGQRQPEQVQR